MLNLKKINDLFPRTYSEFKDDSPITPFRKRAELVFSKEKQGCIDCIVQDFYDLFQFTLSVEEFKSFEGFLLFLYREIRRDMDIGKYIIDRPTTNRIINLSSEKREQQIFDFVEHLVSISICSDVKNIDLRKNIIEYSFRAKNFDKLFKELTYDYCKNRCDKKPAGCCDSNHFKEDVIPEILRLQEIEAMYSGWGDGLHNLQNTCMYHVNEDGCRLILFRPPNCIKYICDNLITHLVKKHGNPAWEFYYSMKDIEPSIRDDFSHVVSSMDKALSKGEKLL